MTTKFLNKLATAIILAFLSSCSMAMNKKTTDLTILSNPQGAQIYIDGSYYGTTPKTLQIEPKKSKMQGLLITQDQTQQPFEIQTWYAIRKGSEGRNCFLDSMGIMFVIPAFSFFSSYCRDFKQKEYFFQTSAQLENSNDFNQNPYQPNNYYNQY